MQSVALGKPGVKFQLNSWCIYNDCANNVVNYSSDTHTNPTMLKLKCQAPNKTKTKISRKFTHIKMLL